MGTSKTVLDNAIREKYIGAVKDFLEKSGEEVLVTGSNEIALPCVDAEGNEKFSDYAAHVKAKEEKAKVAAEKKARKIEADKKAREEKARLKAEAEAKG